MERVNEQIVKERNIRIKRSGNRLLVGIFILFIGAYFLFFTSKVWLPPTYEDIHVTSIGSNVEGSNRKITLLKWEYDEKTNCQEIMLDIQNAAIDGIDRYSWSALDRHNGFCDVEVVAEAKDFVVLHIKNLSPRWTEISLRMDADEEDVDFTTIKIYTSKQAIQKVDAITKKTMITYRKEACDIRIGICEAEIDTKLKEILAANDVIENAKNRIEELERSETYQTEAERMETLEMISGLESEIAGSENEVENRKREIEELNKKIERQKELKQSYEKGGK